MTQVLVTGGSGDLGARVIAALLARGVLVRALSRKVKNEIRVQWRQGDLLDGTGLKAALSNVDAVIHCASNPNNPEEDIQAAQHLLALSQELELRHLVYISIAGIEGSAWFGYYNAKLEVENLIRSGGIPYSILRTTQFHSLASNILQKLENPFFLTVPSNLRLQPIDPETVATRLAELALGKPAGRVADLAGPQRLEFKVLAKTWLQVLGKHKPVLSLPLPVPLFKAFQSLKTENLEPVGITWEAWLARSTRERI